MLAGIAAGGFTKHREEFMRIKMKQVRSTRATRCATLTAKFSEQRSLRDQGRPLPVTSLRSAFKVFGMSFSMTLRTIAFGR
jgi:hypothetical protein